MNFLFPLTRTRDVSAILTPFVKNMARAFDAKIHFLRVETLVDQYVEMRVKDSEEWMSSFVDKHFKRFSAHKAGVVIGDPAEQILKYVEEHDIDCILMGTLGKSGPGSFLFGSVTKDVVGKSPVPVLTVNPYKLTDAYNERNAEYFKQLFSKS